MFYILNRTALAFLLFALGGFFSLAKATEITLQPGGRITIFAGDTANIACSGSVPVPGNQVTRYCFCVEVGEYFSIYSRVMPTYGPAPKDLFLEVLFSSKECAKKLTELMNERNPNCF